MERTNWYKFKSYFYRIWIKTRQGVKSNKRSKYPKKVNNQEKVGAEIFIKVLHDPDSKLYYDLQSHECYLRSSDSTLYLFLESGNLKVINSVYGYDIRLSNPMEIYLSERFRHEMTKRRHLFKKEALSKVKHSLDKTLDKINERLVK